MVQRPPAFDRIEQDLARARRAHTIVVCLRASGWLVTGVGATVLMACLILGWGMDGAIARNTAWAVILATALAAGFEFIWKPLRATHRPGDLANVLEQRTERFDDGLIACVEFARQWPDAGGGSPAMASALAEDVADRLSKVELRTVFPLQTAQRAWLSLLGVVVVWAGAWSLGQSTVSKGLTALLPAPTSNALRETGPLVGDLTLTLTPPEYTGLPERVLPNSTGDFEALKGTRVHVTATTLTPAADVSLRLGDAILPLELADGRDVSGTFVLTAPMKWRFAVTNADGARLVEAMDRRARVRTDAPPVVTLRLPEADLELENLRDVPVAFEARDDFGLRDAAIVIALAADLENPERVRLPEAKGRRFEGADEVDLSIIDAAPGDRIAISVEAHDTNDVDGPQRGVSVTRYITVRSPELAHYELSDRLRKVIEILLDALADRLELRWRGVDEPNLVERLAAVRTVSREASVTLGDIVEDMADDPLTPDEVRLALAGRLGTLEKAIAEEDRTLPTITPLLFKGTDDGIRTGARLNEAVVEALEQSIILVEAMVARLALEDMKAMTDELKVAKERLRELIEAYRNNPNDALKARIMRDIKRLGERMRALKERMAQLRQKLPEEFLNLDGLKKDEVAKGLDQSKAQLDELEKMLEEGRIDEALAALDEMSNALDQLESSLDQDMEDLHNETNPELQRAISELMDQTRDLLKQQESVSEETAQASQREREAQKKALEEELSAALEEVKNSASKLRETVDDMARSELPRIAEEELSHLNQRVGELNRALESNRLMESLEMAERSMDHLNGLERLSRFDPRQKKQRQLVEQGQKQDEDIIRGLSDLIEQARQKSQQANGAQEMKGLGQRQRELVESAGKIRRRMQSGTEKIPGLNGAPMQSIEQANQSMRSAADQLNGEQPGRARAEQKQAEQHLRSLMEGLRNAAKPQQANRQKGGRRHSREKVHIPGAEEYEAPSEFRKELLDAMKEKPDEAYREQVKRYYESLVK